ncbi:DUF92 domain-containing protein [Paenibacillus sp. GCM10023252]|uniref:DUF92 domain-containing protein n=1 Tax=Paenibacillus sp. GCM10023252 TaxID=3252649 RepID=UPI003619F6FA
MEWSNVYGSELLIGIIGSGLIAALALRKGALSRSGAWSAVLMGTGYYVLGGPIWYGALLAFFISSTMWSRWKKHHRAKRTAEAHYEKTSRRDAGQVWANGGAGLALCAAHAVWPDSGWVYAFAGVMASVCADTWATEIGALSKSMPRSVLTAQRVAPGTSGGVTPLGTLAALAGAAFIGTVCALLALLQPAPAAAVAAAAPAALLLAASAAGLAGAFADSLLGASGQAMYRCRLCGSDTERAVHCGAAAERIRGFAWLNNDRVNLLSSLAAGLLGWAIGTLVA